jgi:hypothetical protein
MPQKQPPASTARSSLLVSISPLFPHTDVDVVENTFLVLQRPQDAATPKLRELGLPPWSCSCTRERKRPLRCPPRVDGHSQVDYTGSVGAGLLDDGMGPRGILVAQVIARGTTRQNGMESETWLTAWL